MGDGGKPAIHDGVALIFFAIGFLDHAVEIGDARMNDRRVNGFGQRDGILNRIVDLHVIAIDHANAFDEMEVVAHRKEEAREFARVEPLLGCNGVDDERVAFPMADRVARGRGPKLIFRRMRPAVGIDVTHGAHGADENGFLGVTSHSYIPGVKVAGKGGAPHNGWCVTGGWFGSAVRRLDFLADGIVLRLIFRRERRPHRRRIVGQSALAFRAELLAIALSLRKRRAPKCPTSRAAWRTCYACLGRSLWGRSLCAGREKTSRNQHHRHSR